MPLEIFEERRKLADLSYLVQGITFTVYSDGRGTERLFPFDLVPRIIPRSEWDVIERGLAQRVTALNLYLQDIYGQQRILKDRIIPRNLVYSCKHFRREMVGLSVPRDIYIHISRHRSGARFPHRRSTWFWKTTRARPAAFPMCWRIAWSCGGRSPAPSNCWKCCRSIITPPNWSQILRSLSPRSADRPVIVLLTPGLYNSAYFEHCFLAQEMGIELVEGRDLVVADDCRLHEDHPRADARGCDLSPRGRRFSRSAGVPRRFAGGRAGPDERLSRRQHRARQCGGHGRRRR